MNFWVKNFLFILLFVLKHLPSDYTKLLITAGQCFYRRRINMVMETGVRGFAIERQSSFLPSGKDNKHSI